MTRTVLFFTALAVAITPVSLSKTKAADKDPRAAQARSDPSKGSARDRERRAAHMEVPHDPYVHVSRRERITSPAARPVRNGYVSVQVNVDGAGDNIVGDAANEPSIAVDPTNPSRMAIGWRQFDTITSDFRQAGWGYTTDGGSSWTFPGVVDPGVFRSDPVLDANAQGEFFYNSLTANAGLTEFWCNVYKSTDGGVSWDDGVYAYGGDKQWMTIDRTGGIGHDNIYANWTKWYTCPGCSGHFTRSYDGGATFLPTTNVPGYPLWGTLAVGPDGELYVSGDGFIVAKSTTMQDETLPAQWDFSTTVDLDGSMAFGGGPNPGGLLGQVWIAVDHSDGPTRSNVYLLCSVQRSSTPDPMDIMFARSVDGGVTWSDPVRVNDDPSESNYQWFGTMSVAPNGRIDAIWSDTRNDPGGYDSELYYAYSEDAGVSWSVNEALSPAFDPHLGWPQQDKLGDYYDMVSDDLGVHVAYAATFNGEQDVYYLRIGDTCSNAGAITLDRTKYACESTAMVAVVDCGLNADGGVVEYVTVDIDSESEMGVENVTLTETEAASARFEGSINLSTTDSPGVLWVAEGETVTVTYIDADDGEGGINVEVTDTAVVDCSSPIISNVQAVDIGPFDASVTFDTDEPSLGAVRYGALCDALIESASQSGYRTEHSVRLLGLDDNETYFYIVDAADEAGNPASDDNGGDCYSLTTPDTPAYFTEMFSGDNDLDNFSLVFTPDGSSDYYAGCKTSIGVLPTDPVGGTPLVWSYGNADDGYAVINLSGGVVVSLHGIDYGRFYPGTNGFITFSYGDTETGESLPHHFNQPRISALFDDLDPSAGGSATWQQLADRAVVTFQNVPEWNTSNSNTFQIEMYFDGTIVISYLSIAAADGLAGLSEGGGTPPAFWETDLSALGNCDGEVVAPWPENSLGITDCMDDGDCENEAKCVQGICYVPKHRYISIARNPEQAAVTARRVKLDTGDLLGWVGEPYYVEPLQEPAGIHLAEIVDGPAYVAAWPDVVHVTGCQIAHASLCDPGGYHCKPNSCPEGETCVEHSYHIQAIPFGSDPGNESNYSEVLELHTNSTWGDTVSTITLGIGKPPNGVVGIEDVIAAVKKYTSVDVAPLTWLDIDPSQGSQKPDQVIGIGDIMKCIDGYQGKFYPGDGPLSCP